MDRKFDLRLQADREALAAFLPIIDNRLINIPPAIFVDALKNTSEFLDNPDWLAYQWGTVGSLHFGNTQAPVELLEVAELGLELRDLSRHENFEALICSIFESLANLRYPV